MTTPVKSTCLYRNITPWLLILLPMMYLTACGPTTETIVVGGQARAIEAEGDEAEIMQDDEIAVLRLGESNQIRSFDPLFAINTATKRAIQLLYEGLVRFDENDGVVPAAAQRWEVSGDSLTYTFYLRSDLFFHDDESFTQGRGRRVNSQDIVRVFERMASRDVPPNGAELFMNDVKGFEAFYLEQREIYFAEDREITSISGIETPNTTTVTFQLLEPNRNFLKKLASPYAVIYPNEAFRFRSNGLHRHAVGTGPFAYERSTGDSLHIFIRNNTYYGRDDRGRQLPRVPRIELHNITDENRVYSLLSGEQLDMIIDLGPVNVAAFINDNNELKEEFRNRFRLEISPNYDPVILRYNARNRFGLGRADAASVIRNTDQPALLESTGFPSLEIVYKDDEYSQINIGRVYNQFGIVHQNNLVFAFNQDLLPRALSRNIYQTMDNNLRVTMVQRRAFSRDIFLYLDYLTSYFPGDHPARQPQEILRLRTSRYLLFDRSIEGVRTNSLSWWLNLNHIRIHSEEIGEQANIFENQSTP